MTEPRPRRNAELVRQRLEIIVRKKTLEENGGNLRQVMNYPGTGPFKHVERRDKEIWIQERNPKLLEQGAAVVDRLEIYHGFPFSPEHGAAFLAGKTDYARLLDPISWRKAKEMKGVTAGVFNPVRDPGVLDEHAEEQGAGRPEGAAGRSTWSWTAPRWSRS
jgi:ABC-type oligopeptide transport system substrate-binding subunit